MDPGGLIPEAPKLPGPGALDPLRDGTTRIWMPGDQVYRFAWILSYRSGVIRRQYERVGDMTLQTLFARIPHDGIARIRILDLERPPESWFYDIDVPTDAEVDILYNCSLSMGGGGIRRIYTFGFRRPGLPGFYVHLDPSIFPLKLWHSERRIL